MKKRMWLIVLGVLSLSGCSSSTRQSTSPLFLKVTPKPTPSETPNLSIIKLDPSFRFVVKDLRFMRYTSSNTVNERILFSAYLTHTGPKPKWWGKWPKLYSLTFITDKGKKYVVKDVAQAEDHFNRGEEVYALYSQVDVPKLKKTERVVETEAVFSVEDSGLVKVTVDIPRENQRLIPRDEP